jgi:mycofactocin precursor
MTQTDVPDAEVQAAMRAPDVTPTHGAQAAAAETASAPTEALVEEDLLIEDVSIDGMCGVY